MSGYAAQTLPRRRLAEGTGGVLHLCRELTQRQRARADVHIESGVALEHGAVAALGIDDANDFAKSILHDLHCGHQIEIATDHDGAIKEIKVGIVKEMHGQTIAARPCPQRGQGGVDWRRR